MKEWWKMVIFHFKHSYLNWRVIPCRRRMICVYTAFSSFSQHFFWLLDSRLDLIEFFKCMIWQSIFHFFFTSGNNACHRWPSKLKHLFSCEDCFERLAFWSKVVYIILSKERIMAQKCFREMGNFGQHALRDQLKMISRYHDLGTFVFGHWKGFDRLETIASLNTYQI